MIEFRNTIHFIDFGFSPINFKGSGENTTTLLKGYYDIPDMLLNSRIGGSFAVGDVGVTFTVWASRVAL